MNTSNDTRYDKLLNRHSVGGRLRYFTEYYRRARGHTGYKYLVGTMQPIDPEYTDETFRQGDSVKDILQGYLDESYQVKFDYQGSVTSDTHILDYSDIDLLTLHGGFVTRDRGAPLSNRYDGYPLADLSSLRIACEIILPHAFSDVDISGGKAIAVVGDNQRKIDVVVGNWWNTERYRRFRFKKFRGVTIFDSKTKERLRNLPFLHNARIDRKDKETNTGLRKAIRLLKSLRYDADPILPISSYDIAALGYAIPDNDLLVGDGAYLQLALNVNRFLKQMIGDSTVRNSLKVPNGTRLIFCAKGATFAGLKALQAELEDLLASINHEDKASNVLINEAVTELGFGEDLAPWAETRSSRVAALTREANAR